MGAPRRVLVTGGAGFIGSHLCEALIGRGDTVVAFDSFHPYYARELKERNLDELRGGDRFRLVEGDLRDSSAVSALFEDEPYDAVVHLAARAGVRPSLEDPEGYVETNVRGTATLLEAMRRADCRQLVFASSSSVYGNSRSVPFHEDDRVDFPISPYAMTKKAGEEVCHVYHAVHGFSVICLRFFTVYGPRQRPDMAIHKFVRLMHEGRAIPVFGDGSMERDFTYCADVIEGVVAAADRVASGDGYVIVNLGESAPVRLSELIEALGRATGIEPRIEREPVPPGDVERTFADVSRAKALLGYEPRTALDEGLRRFVEWYRETMAASGA